MGLKFKIIEFSCVRQTFTRPLGVPDVIFFFLLRGDSFLLEAHMTRENCKSLSMPVMWINYTWLICHCEAWCMGYRTGFELKEFGKESVIGSDQVFDPIFLHAEGDYIW